MLFLQALLFFMFGISVVAITTSPMISNISRRGQESKGQTPSSPHTGHNAQLEEPDLDGLWETHSIDDYPPYTYMRIRKGTITGIWPRISFRQLKRLQRRLEEKDWKRVDPASEVNIKSAELLVAMSRHEVKWPTFHEGSLSTEFMDRESIEIKFGPKKLKMEIPFLAKPPRRHSI